MSRRIHRLPPWHMGNESFLKIEAWQIAFAWDLHNGYYEPSVFSVFSRSRHKHFDERFAAQAMEIDLNHYDPPSYDSAKHWGDDLILKLLVKLVEKQNEHQHTDDSTRPTSVSDLR